MRQNRQREEDDQIVQWPDSQDSTNIERADVDISGYRFFEKEERRDEESTEHEEQNQARAPQHLNGRLIPGSGQAPKELDLFRMVNDDREGREKPDSVQVRDVYPALAG